MSGINNGKKIITSVFIGVLAILGIYFLFNIFTVIVKPLFLEDSQEKASVSLDASLDEAIDYLQKREDLTGSTPSATLTEESKILKAEVVNGSGIAGIARQLANELESIGIVTEVGNSTVEAEDTVISLKVQASTLRDAITEKVGTKSGEIRFEVLDDTDTFDIRILIGK